MVKRGLLGLGLAALLVGPRLAPGAELAADGGCAALAAPRVVAVGDVHGAYDSLVDVLRFAGIVDAKAKWAGGKAHLVQTGDLLDRGTDTRKVLDLMMRLEGEASKAGGRVHALLGNHEVMNIVGDLRYVNKEEYKAFQEPESARRREHFYEDLLDQARARARAAGQPFDADAFQAKFLEQVPIGFVERTAALSAEGHYGRWLRRRPVIVKINGVVFLHGGLTPEVAALGCEVVNATVRREITDDLAKTRQEPAATLAAGENGPLWYRGLAKLDEATLLPSVERILQSLGARAVVVGHSVTGDGRIQARFGGRVVGIDVGMDKGYGGNLAALEVGPEGSLTALYRGGREELVRPAAAAAGPPRGYSSRFAYASP